MVSRKMVSAHTEKGKTMDNYDATEIAYKNGLADGTPKWIPVTERLPAKYKDVLTYRLSGCDVDCCIDTKSGKWFGDAICCYDVTHWMPLPEPPKVA